MINTARHINVFDPAKIEGKSICVIGAGATGSRIAYELIKLGIPQFDVWDFDTIESHNVGNQLFNIEDIGKYKADVIADLGAKNGCKVIPHIKAITADDNPYNIVFMCADDMSIRQEITKKWLRTATTKILIETRMSFNEVRVYALTKMAHIKPWLEVSSYSNEQSEESVCGSKSSVGATASIASMYAIWQLINIVNNKQIYNEIIASMDPMDFLTRKF